MQEEIFIDDETVPAETIVCYSKSEAKFYLWLSAIFGIASSWLMLLIVHAILVDGASWGTLIFYVALFPLAAYCIKTFYYTYIEYQKAVKKEPQIILNEYGLQTVKTKLKTWDRVQVSVITEPIDKNNNSLVYRYEDGKEVLHIGTTYDISTTDLNRLLKIYQGRFYLKNPKPVSMQVPTGSNEMIQVSLPNIDSRDTPIGILNFDDDEKVPFETKILYSKSDGVWGVLGSIFFVIISCWGAISLYQDGKIFFFLVLLFFALLSLLSASVFYDNFKKALNKIAQIIINEEGMQTMHTKFLTWDNIKEEKVQVEGSGKEIKHYLMYDYEGGKAKFYLNDSEIDISPQNLHHLLKIYRGRFEQKRNKENLPRN